jgi:nucleoside-diphosphate-sugar epimerase
MTSKQIGIIGLGWLGSSLAQSLNQHHYQVWGTNRKKTNAINSYHFDFHTPEPLPPCDVLILNTPPLLDLAPPDYVEIVSGLKFQSLIFISSTSVFGASQGEVQESTPPLPDTFGGKWLVEVEEKLRQFDSTVIRPGGLIGKNRHPARYLSGKMLADPEAVVNLIHLDDLIQIILKMIVAPLPLIHAVSPFHPTRWEYYKTWAQKLDLPLPLLGSTTGLNKIVSSQHLPHVYSTWTVEKLDRL